MSKYDVEIDLKSLESTINKMNNDLIKLEIEMNNIYNAYSSLDETKWIGFDKKNIDSGFGNYLKDKTNYCNNLRNTLNILKNAYSGYETIETKINKNIENMEDK